MDCPSQSIRFLWQDDVGDLWGSVGYFAYLRVVVDGRMTVFHTPQGEPLTNIRSTAQAPDGTLDLAGVEWPALVDAAARLRLVIVPIANPDGRARIPTHDQLAWSVRDMEASQG